MRTQPKTEPLVEQAEEIMQGNIGAADRAIRIIVGLGLLSLIFLLQGPGRWFGVIGLVPLLTALVRFCPLYRILGISSSPPVNR